MQNELKKIYDDSIPPIRNGVMVYKSPFLESALAIQNRDLKFPSQPVYSSQLQGFIRYCLKFDTEERLHDLYDRTTAIDNALVMVANPDHMSLAGSIT